MANVIVSTRVDADERRLFVQATDSLGTTPSNAIKMFIRAFIEQGGFPFDVSHPYSYELKGEALDSYRELMAQIEEGTARGYANHQEIVDELVSQ
jgi:DNA-damage-inducible protein J